MQKSKDQKFHHNVYVVLLDAAAGKLRAVRAANPDADPSKPCVFVGMTVAAAPLTTDNCNKLLNLSGLHVS